MFCEQTIQKYYNMNTNVEEKYEKKPITCLSELLSKICWDKSLRIVSLL